MNPESLIGAVLRGESIPWPVGAGSHAVERLLAAGHAHGVLPLLDAAFRNRPQFEAWPKDILTACHQAALVQAGYELAQGVEIERVLSEFARATIKPLFLKGTGLAYSLYSSPVHRPRADSDLLVMPEWRESAWEILRNLGYRRMGGPAGEFVGYQLQAQIVDARGIAHNIDLHWRLRDEQSFAWLLSFSELAAEAIPVPKLNPRALRLGNAHSLLLCLMHRAGNNLFQSPGFGDRLIWLYDIQLLVAAMTILELDTFCALAATRGVGALAVDGLTRCAEPFPSARLATLIDRLERSPQAKSGGEFLTAGRLRREWIELRAIPGGGPRLAYLAARAFPRPEYMRERYPDLAARALPLLHARRWVEGLRNYVRSSRA